LGTECSRADVSAGKLNSIERAVVLMRLKVGPFIWT